MIEASSVYAHVDNISWTYAVSDDKVILGGGSASIPAIPTSTAGDLIIPETIDGYPVVAIGDYAFANCSLLTSVTIPSSVEVVGARAFSGCGNLTSVHLSEGSLRTLKNHAFCECTALTDVVIPNGVADIGTDIFVHCHSLTNAVIPMSVTNIEQYAFSYCNHLQELTLPFIGSGRGNQGTADSVFGHIFGLKQYDGLVKVTQDNGAGTALLRFIPNSLKRVYITDETVVPHAAFENCSNLTSVVIGNSVTNIAKGAFSGCGGLERITLPFIGSERGNHDTDDSVFGYVFGADSYNGSLLTIQHYTGPSPSPTVTNYLPSALKSVTITDETRVGYGAFYQCA